MIPHTPGALVEMWRKHGYQHFHLNTTAGGGVHSHHNGPYITWVLVTRRTKVCDDRARCLIVPVH